MENNHKLATSFQLNENFDFELDTAGRLGMQSGTESVMEMISFDLANIQNWVLRESLGMDWINENNDGLLQKKNMERQIVSSIVNKVQNRNDVRTVDEILFSVNKANRTMSIKLTITINTGEVVKFTTEI